ncbi:hypothetical protein LWI28_022813 [Acer negundo]|uniref:Pentatricopeptide repeat-containing protein n=1 Tax=Acer negundo TaxID=4023 RepID=A0AAD5NH09_ACENE|nr:hypothetical protein LWI28_022813 [Acer negundo]
MGLLKAAAPDSFTFAFLLKAAANYGSLMPVCSSIVKLYFTGLSENVAVGGDLESSERLFESIPFKGSTSRNLMLAGYAKAGEMEMVWKVFSEMEVKEDVSWSSMITALTQNGCFDGVFGVFMDLRQLGMRPNEVSI